jgi:hypothetical protein
MRRTWTTWAAATGLDGRDGSAEPGADEERARAPVGAGQNVSPRLALQLTFVFFSYFRKQPTYKALLFTRSGRFMIPAVQ